jgi:hypothetical protein
VHAELVAVAASQGGVFTAAQARAVGYSRDEIRARLASGRWHRERRGIFRASGPVDGYALAVAAAVLACARSGAAASHQSAAHLLGLPLLHAPDRVELTVPESALTSAVKGCIIHRAPLRDCLAVGPVRATSPERTVVDLARTSGFVDGVVAADRLLASWPDATARLRSAASRLRGCQGYGRVERVLGFASGRSGSVGESVARVVMAEHGLPPPLLGELVVHDGELLGVVDFLWPAHRTIAEFDGRLKYLPGNSGGDGRLWDEKRREDRLRDAGYEVVRIAWDEARRRGAELARRVRAAFVRAAERPSTRFTGP